MLILSLGLFISSPGDVRQEHAIAKRVIQRLQGHNQLLQ